MKRYDPVQESFHLEKYCVRVTILFNYLMETLNVFQSSLIVSLESSEHALNVLDDLASP